MSASWTEHKAPSGRTYYFDRVSGKSTWERPAEFGKSRHVASPSLQSCLDESPQVAALFNAIIHHCGVDALPTVRTRPVVAEDGTADPLCAGGRGGGFCCASKRIFVCAHQWTSCREVAYELSHALNACRGLVHCRREGMTVDGADCGYLGPPDVACSEWRASYWTGRCDRRPEGARRLSCHEWHARWATQSCYPKDEHLEAHVRWARNACRPEGADADLARPSAKGGTASTFVDQAMRVP